MTMSQKTVFSGPASRWVARRERFDRRASKPDWHGGKSLQEHTTLNLALQTAAENAVRDGIARIERQRSQLAGGVQAAVVAIEPASGEIRALVGGRGYRDSPFNRATSAVRQPGSLFKPLVYLAAFGIETRPKEMVPDPSERAAMGGQ